MVLFIIPYKVALAFEFVDDVLNCDHSTESYCVKYFCHARWFYLMDVVFNGNHSIKKLLSRLPCGTVYLRCTNGSKSWSL